MSDNWSDDLITFTPVSVQQTLLPNHDTARRDAQPVLTPAKWQTTKLQLHITNFTLEVCGSTLTRGYGSGTGTKSTGRVYPFSTRKEHHFSRCWSYIECFFNFFLPSERELAFTFARCRRPSVCLSSVCLSVVCNVRAPYLGD